MPLARVRVPGSSKIRTVWVTPDGRSTRPGVMDAVIAAFCGYEVAAIVSGERLPTLSRIQHRHRIVGAAIVGYLTWHFVRYKPKNLLP